MASGIKRACGNAWSEATSMILRPRRLAWNASWSRTATHLRHGHEPYAERFARSFNSFTQVTDEHKYIGCLLRRMVHERNLKLASILDVGAGPGLIAAQVSPLADAVVALEPNSRFLSRLRRTGVSVRQAFVETEEIESRFDLVLLSHVLYYVDSRNRLPVLRKLCSWLRPGGVVVVVLDVLDGVGGKFLQSFLPRVGGLDDIVDPWDVAASMRRLVRRVEEVRFQAHVATRDRRAFVKALRFYLEPHELGWGTRRDLDLFAGSCRVRRGYALPMDQVMLVGEKEG